MPIQFFNYLCRLCEEEYTTKEEARDCFKFCCWRKGEYEKELCYACQKCGLSFGGSLTSCKMHEITCTGAIKYGSCNTCRHLDAEGRRYDPCPEKTTGNSRSECPFWEAGK